MSATTVGAHAAPARSVSTRLRTDPAFQAFTLLRIGFTVAPILFGIDKFANVMVDWSVYLAPWINDILPGSAERRHVRDRRRRDRRRPVLSPCARATAPCSSPPGSAASSSTCSPTRATTTSPCATSA